MYKIVFFFLAIASLNAQQISVFNIDVSSYPIIEGSFYAWDSNWSQLKLTDVNNFTLSEDGELRDIVSISCPEPKLPDAISSVIMIDISKTMAGSKIELAKSAARGWVAGMPDGKGETAICTFGNRNYFNQDFTDNKPRLFAAIDNISAQNVYSDFDVGFLSPNAGALLTAEKAKRRKLVLFITDGKSNCDKQKVIERARQINAVIYCIIVDNYTPPLLQEIARETGGACYSNITTQKDAQQLYNHLLAKEYGAEPCTISWTTTEYCEAQTINIELTHTAPDISINTSYKIPEDLASKLVCQPAGVFFCNMPLNVITDTTVTVTAINGDFDITDITVTSAEFSIEPDNFHLNAGESIDLTLKIKPTDKEYKYCIMDFINDLCQKKYYSSAAWDNAAGDGARRLKITHPNGNEVFQAGNDSVVTWEGVLPNDKVAIEFSNDNGANWTPLTYDATNFRYEWNNIPPPASDNCLMKVSVGAEPGDIATIHWQRTFGGLLQDRCRSVVHNNFGGYVVAGYTPSSDGDFDQNHGGTDVWMINLDNTGNIIWKTCVATDENDCVYDMVNTNDLGYLLVGHIQNGSKDSVSAIKVDMNGNVLWTKKYFGGHQSVVLCTKDGGFLLLQDGIKICRLEENGDLIWEKSIGGSGKNQYGSITHAKGGGYLFCGTTNSTDGDVDPTNYHGKLDIWVVKLDDDLNIVWQKLIGGSDNDIAESILQDEQGFIYVLGETYSSDGDANGQHGIGETTDLIVAKLDSNGKLIWSNCYGDLYREIPCQIVTSNDGGIVIAAGSYSTFNGKVGFRKMCNYWIFKLNADGTIEWERFFGGTGNDVPYEMLKTFDDGFLIIGDTDSDDIDVENLYNITDYWILKLWPDNGKPYQEDISDAQWSIVEPQCTAEDVYMGEVVVQDYSVKIISTFLNNPGQFPITVDNVSISGADATNFKVMPGYLPVEIAPGKAAPVEFVFTPLKLGPIAAQIDIKYQSRQTQCNISGVGLPRTIRAVTDMLDFGIVQVLFDSVKCEFVAENIAAYPIVIDSVKQLGPDFTQFHIDSGATVPFTIQPGAQHKMKVRFSPTKIGRTSGSIGLYFDDDGSPAIIDLYGSGIAGAIRALDDSCYPGDIIDIRGVLEVDEKKKFADVVNAYDITLAVDKTLLAPVNKSLIDSISGDCLYFTTSGNIDPDSEFLFSEPCVAGLGKAEESSIEIERVILYSTETGLPGEYDIDRFPGTFKLLGICKEGGSRLINPNSQIGFRRIAPNPVGSLLTLEFELTEKGHSEVIINNYLGQTILQQTVQPVLGDVQIHISTAGLAPGLYYVLLNTPTHSEAQKIIIAP